MNFDKKLDQLFKPAQKVGLNAYERWQMGVEMKLTIWRAKLINWLHMSAGRRPLAIIAALLMLLVAAGGVWAAEKSLPGDSLYPLKLKLHQSVGSALQVNPELSARWELREVKINGQAQTQAQANTQSQTSTSSEASAQNAALEENLSLAIESSCSRAETRLKALGQFRGELREFKLRSEFAQILFYCQTGSTTAEQEQETTSSKTNEKVQTEIKGNVETQAVKETKEKETDSARGKVEGAIDKNNLKLSVPQVELRIRL